MSRSASVAKPIDYMLRRWDRFIRFGDDGGVCLTNNAAERAADRGAAMTTLIMMAKLNDVDPLAWLADVLTRIADIPQGRLSELLPWNWKQASLQAAA